MNTLLYRQRAMMAEQKKDPDYLRFTALEDNSSVKIVDNQYSPACSLEYSLNGESWVSYTYGTDIFLDTDDYVMFRKADDTVIYKFSYSIAHYRYFVMSGSINGSGNVMSLLDKSMESDECQLLCNLFANCKSLKTPPKLPATILGAYCYYSMFRNCGLIKAPLLPATTLSYECYRALYYGNNSLLDVPPFIANNLYSGCYTEIIRNTNIESVEFNTINDSLLIFGNSRVKAFIIHAKQPPVISQRTFELAASTLVIYVPDDSVSAYKAAQ